MNIRKNPKLCIYAACKNSCVYNLEIQWYNNECDKQNYNLCYEHIQEVFDVNQSLIKTGVVKFTQGPPK